MFVCDILVDKSQISFITFSTIFCYLSRCFCATICSRTKLLRIDCSPMCFNSMQASLESCVASKDLKKDMKRIRSEFEVERERFERALPVYARRTDILDAIANNQVKILDAV